MAQWIVADNEAINLDRFVYIVAEMRGDAVVVHCVEPYVPISDEDLKKGKLQQTSRHTYQGKKAQAIVDALKLKPSAPPTSDRG